MQPNSSGAKLLAFAEERGERHSLALASLLLGCEIWSCSRHLTPSLEEAIGVESLLDLACCPPWALTFQ